MLDPKNFEQAMGPKVGPTASGSGTALGQRRLTSGGLCLLKSGDVQSGLVILGLFVTKIERIASQAASGYPAASALCPAVRPGHGDRRVGGGSSVRAGDLVERRG
jgi:hypothetical protein